MGEYKNKPRKEYESVDSIARDYILIKGIIEKEKAEGRDVSAYVIMEFNKLEKKYLAMKKEAELDKLAA